MRRPLQQTLDLLLLQANRPKLSTLRFGYDCKI
ncbi:hypothetical protein AHF37_01526 [Paragonimus kellicotti]|nr:hypothetical protein AHF37_01526 [Paragonimus kellicotti]